MTEERPQAVRTMALHEHEQRKLDEIEQHLAEESPLLVRHFTALRPVSTSVVVCGVLGALVLLFTGLVIMVVGVRLAAPGPHPQGSAQPKRPCLRRQLYAMNKFTATSTTRSL